VQLDLILEQWRVRQLEELDEAAAREVQAWLEQQ
jgi:hypothetical protein